VDDQVMVCRSLFMETDERQSVGALIQKKREAANQQ
jgi:hypothetical protein